MRVEDGFQPIPYPELHPYIDDPVIPSLLQRLIPASIRPEIEADLVRFGNDVKGYIRTLSPLVHPPKLIQYDQWGRRIDQLITSEGWRKLKDIAILEGLVAIPHERTYAEHSRVYGFAKAMIFSGDSHVVMCSTSMTDGAARVLELFGTDDMRHSIRRRLISRDPSFAFTSGQWMTERPGGSDVSQTETIATPPEGNAEASPAIGTLYSLDGFKWFSSATDSDMAVALARTGSPDMGSRSLSLFLVPLRLPFPSTRGASSISNGIHVHRLKDKFGTHAVPTAELSLKNTKAYLLSPLNQGVRSIAPVLNITRMYSAVMLVGGLSRAFAIARSYATVRSITARNAQGNSSTQRLVETPLHMSVIAKVGTTYYALAHLTFGAVALLGKSECGTSNEDEERRLRLLTPAVKAFVSDKAVAAMEDCMACLGGQGYIEENVIGRLIRDCSVDRIWEGTISVLSLDLLRASRGDNAVRAFIEWARGIIASVSPLHHETQLHDSLNLLVSAVETLPGAFAASATSPFVPRPLLFLFAYTAASLYLLEHIVWGYHNRGTYSDWTTDANVFKRWVEEGLDVARKDLERASALSEHGERHKEDLEIVYGPGASSVLQAKL